MSKSSGTHAANRSASHTATSLRQHRIRALAPGLLVCGVIAGVAIWAARFPFFASKGLSALPLAIVIGLIVGNTVYARLAERCHGGVTFAKGQLLRAGIILYGLHLTFQDMSQVGWSGVMIAVLVVCSTFLLAQLVGQKLLGMDARTTMLIGAGSAICGAAAVLATEPVVRGRVEDVSVAVATVVVFGTVGTFLYPALFHWNLAHGWLPFSDTQFGLYVGTTVHEVAQVVAAADAVSANAAGIAVIAKMVRVMLLAPFLLAISIWLSSHHGSAAVGHGKRRIVIPWFAVAFIGVAGIHSLGILPNAGVKLGIALDNALLAVAMAALGLTTHVSAVRAAGSKPLLLALLLFAWLLLAGLLMNLWLAAP